MEATVLNPIKHEHPRLTSTPIDDYFLISKFKVELCPFGDCKKGPAKCPFLHPGEKGRRHPHLFFYLEYPCWDYSSNGGSCPRGDHCKLAHGFLERRFHPVMYSCMKGLQFWDLEQELLVDPHRLDADERAAIEHILSLKSNGLINGYEPKEDTLLVDDDIIGNDLARARKASVAIFKSPLSSIKVVTPEGIFAISNKLFPGHDKDIAFVTTEERMGRLRTPQLLSVTDASPTAGGRVPKDPKGDRFHVDSGASIHVVGNKGLLQGYRDLPEPWPIAVADGYSLVVAGTGFISLDCFVIPNVFYVEGLRVNLISVSQLDRDHGLFSGFHDGICKIIKHDGDIIGGGFLLPNGLYALSFLQVPGTGEEAM